MKPTRALAFLGASRVRATIIALASVALAMNLAVWLAGAAPAHVWVLVLEGTFGSAYGIAQTLAKATPLALTGAAVALALRAGLFNIGAEGQLAVGVLATAVVGARLPTATPGLIAMLVCAAAAAGAGFAVGALPGWLKGRFGAHEVITTLMLNGLIAVLTTYLYGGPLRVGEQVHTRAVLPAARIPPASAMLEVFRGSALNLTLLLALIAPFVVEFYLRRSARGLAIRAMGSNAGAARALGVPTTATTAWAMGLSGAIAALAGLHYVLGVKGFAEEGMGSGVGFAGIAVAMLAQGRPIGILGAALLFGALSQGGLAVNAIVPADTLAVAQAAALVAIAALIAHGAAGPRGKVAT